MRIYMKKAMSVIETVLIASVVVIVAIGVLKSTNIAIMDLAKKTTAVEARN